MDGSAPLAAASHSKPERSTSIISSHIEDHGSCSAMRATFNFYVMNAMAKSRFLNFIVDASPYIAIAYLFVITLFK